MSGAGIQAAGTSSAGFGTSAAATEFGGAFLRDTRTGRSLGARKIDPSTRDYVLDENGRQLGQSYVQHAVQLSIHTERDSSAVRGFGRRKFPDRVTPNIERQMLAILTEAVQPLIDLGYIEVIGFKHFSVGTDTNGLPRAAVHGRFDWRDLSTGKIVQELI